MINITLKLLTVVLFLAWLLYWQIEQRKAYKSQPLTKEKPKLINILSRIGIRTLFIFVLIQLLGITLFPMTHYIVAFQYIGVFLIFFGVLISVNARVVLSSNWSNAYEYQIKKGQKLVEQGVYAFIRHPIYSGMTFMFIGAEMVTGSWLWVSFLGLFVGAYIQGKREEKILLAHFGEEYRKYMKKTKMLIPWVL